ncbi:MAG: BlaI/MecI/CopY family transcriptional regulator [Armatimonadetes bacterium]|nr:BlaI/MecI/CopY family transcriptional regulator [Armatimonadota bacterium]MCX7967118.1 BlaI/MecI/CopY family transcriptional regulator [Armatimonadota bacterium]MDW8142705.1 BlaI/MecI/CopY family transcriptional regulator [Armatimonadota bacterium]
MRRVPRVGRMEAEILRFVTEHHPVTVREVAEYFAQTKGYARTTVLTVMERLRKKGYLKRKKVGNTYQYSPSQPKTALFQSLVRDFVQSVLGGSIAPFVAYLSQEAKLSDEELRELRQLVLELEERKRKA